MELVESGAPVLEKLRGSLDPDRAISLLAGKTRFVFGSRLFYLRPLRIAQHWLVSSAATRAHRLESQLCKVFFCTACSRFLLCLQLRLTALFGTAYHSSCMSAQWRQLRITDFCF